MKKLYHVAITIFYNDVLSYYKDTILSSKDKKELQKELFEKIKEFFHNYADFDCEIKIDEFNCDEMDYCKVHVIYPACGVNGYVQRLFSRNSNRITIEL